MHWIITELYYPEETSTGHFLTQISEGVAVGSEVSVICSQPTYSQRGVKAAKFETHNGVQIYRCWGGRLNKDFLPFRIINFLTISFSLFIKCLFYFKRGDKVVVVTNPPLLPLLVTLASKIKGCKTVLLVHDVYPEVLVTAGMLKSGSLIFRFVHEISKRIYVGVEAIVVIGRDMREIALRKCHDSNKIHVITNWADLDTVSPLLRSQNKLLETLGLQQAFVVQYCGNMGRTHGLEYLVECASLIEDKQVEFMFMGGGARKAWLIKEINNRELTNTSVLPRCSRELLSESLNACDLAVISFMPGMSGISVPSRMYNIMAAGKPILAIADADSELATVVQEENIGWVVAPGDIDSLISVINEAKSDINRLNEMGERARSAVKKKYTLGRVINSYRDLLDSL